MMREKSQDNTHVPFLILLVFSHTRVVRFFWRSELHTTIKTRERRIASIEVLRKLRLFHNVTAAIAHETDHVLEITRRLHPDTLQLS